MKRLKTFLLFGSALLINGACVDKSASIEIEKKLNEQCQNGFWGDMGDGTYRNPIIASDFSDPDPIRVGNDYYMVASTFETYPGITVLHSKDLVNWEIIGSVFDEFSKVSDDFMASKMSRYNLGVYAPSIRYHNGMFYVYVNLISDGMYCATTKDPAGKWDVQPLLDKNGKPLRLTGWTDPCPFWDEDGKAYLASSRPGTIWHGYLFQMTPDGKQLLDADVEHMSIPEIEYEFPKGGTVYSPNFSTEGNKIYKHNDYYYILHIEFLEGGNGAGTYIYRSKNIYGTKKDGTPGKPGDLGEYEMMRTDRHGIPYKQTLPGQGGFVDTPDGRWFWIAQFNQYGADGRVPCLLPVTWVDGWPIIGDTIIDNFGTMAWRLPKPIASEKIVLPHGSDDFSSSKLKKIWAWNHQPDNSKWSLNERPGFLRLYASKTADGTDCFFKSSNTIEQRYMSSDSVCVSISVDLSGMSEGQKAGLVHFNGGKNYGMIGVKKKTKSYELYYESDNAKTGSIEFTSDMIYLRTTSTFDYRDWSSQFTSEGANFSYSFDNKEYISFGNEYMMCTANFRGDMIGIFTYNNKRNDGYVDVDYFEYKVFNRR